LKQNLLTRFTTGLVSSFFFLNLSLGADIKNTDNTQIKQDNDSHLKSVQEDNDKSADVYRNEIAFEIEKLKKIREEVEKKIKEDKKILQQIKQEREKLKQEREDFEKYIKQVENERYKKLAKVFEKMEPELAGEKISKIKNPKVAAYIIYNMKERKAGEVMNYVDPKMVNKIVKILTDLKNQKNK